MNIFDGNSIVEETPLKDDFTIVVITHNRTELLNLLVNSLNIALQRYGKTNCDIVICVNGKDSKTDEYLKNLSLRIAPIPTQIITLDRPVTPAAARNIATATVQSEWVMFLDDDVEIPPELFNNFKKLVKSDPQAALWGGPNLTPESSTYTQQKIGWLLQSYLVTGPISSRYKLNKIESIECKGNHLSLCNIFIKTQVFRSILFNTKLKTAEENELFHKLTLNNRKMKSSDLLYVWHCRRASVPHFLGQIKNYGYGRGQLIYHGMISTPLKIFIFFGLILFLFSAIKFPLLLATGALFWLIVIFVSFAFNFRMKNNSPVDILLPMRLWYNYFLGIIIGYKSSYLNRHSHLRG